MLKYELFPHNSARLAMTFSRIPHKPRCLPIVAGVVSTILFQSASWGQNQSQWIKLPGSITGGDIYVKATSIKNIRSVEFKNTVYRRGDFSYTDYDNTTTRKRLVFDCEQSSYKNDDYAPGYYVDISWITPFTNKNSIESIGYRYLCPGVADPWAYFGENASKLTSKTYYINTQTISNRANPGYGRIQFGIVVEGYLTNMTELGVFAIYVSCDKNLVSTLDMSNYLRPSNPSISFNEINPGSNGQVWRDALCSART